VTATLENIIRAGAYQRISFDKAGDEHGVANQLTDQQRTAAARGYTIVMEESDNDISALTGKYRPGYQRIMAAAARGEIDVILVFQTSRFWRNRRERAEGIEILRKAGVSLIATRGPSLDMSNAYGRMMAGLLGEFDTAESEIKSERQQLANREAAVAGKIRKGTPRPFGWKPNRITRDPAEAEAVETAYRALLAGGTVAGVVRDWERRGVRPHQAPESPWTRTSVRQILLNPRNAGIAMYRGAEVGRGEWEPIVDEQMFRATVQMLGENKQWSKGVTTMLGGIARCRCGNQVGGSTSARGHNAYRCIQGTRGDRPGPHVHVIAGPVDEFIGKLVVHRLSEPDAMDLVVPKAKGNATALQDEAMGIRQRLDRLGPLFALGEISEVDLKGGRREGEIRLAEIEAELADLGRESVLAPLVAARNMAAAWEGLGTDRRRAVVNALMTVTLNPSGRGARTFSARRTISIDWCHPLPDGWATENE
jgi:DNA invertase Pin-like site-specific DNA recombinase